MIKLGWLNLYHHPHQHNNPHQHHKFLAPPPPPEYEDVTDNEAGAVVIEAEGVMNEAEAVGNDEPLIFISGTDGEAIEVSNEGEEEEVDEEAEEEEERMEFMILWSLMTRRERR